MDGLKKRKPIVGADPGKYNILYMSDASVSNGKIKKLRYTAVQSKQEGGSSRRDVIMEYEKGRRKFADLTIQDYETFLSMCNSKTVDYERFKTYIHVKSMVSSMVGSFYEDEKWRKIKFRTYSNKQKSIDTFLTKVGTTFGKDAVIAYGDWSRKTQMKFFMPTMGIGFRKLMSKRFLTISINEYNTSKLCNVCGSELGHLMKNEESVFRCLICSNGHKDCITEQAAQISSELLRKKK